MVKIYCIEDINDLKYVGSTKQKYLSSRFSQHRIQKNCSSQKLNLYNSIIYQLEECSEDQCKERERYWINKLDSVNQKKLNGRDKENQKEYREKNKEKLIIQQKEYREKNKEKRKEYMKKYRLKI